MVFIFNKLKLKIKVKPILNISLALKKVVPTIR
jgi:hypothetical protein